MANRKNREPRHSAADVFASLLAGRFANAAVSAVTFIVVARLLGPSNYGIYALAISLSLLINSMGHFGIGTYLNRHLSAFLLSGEKEKMGIAISNSFFLVASMALALTLFGIAISPYVSAHLFSSKVGVLSLILASTTIFFSVIYGTSYQALVGLREGAYAMLLSISSAVMQMFFSIGLVLLGFGVNGAIIGVLIGYISAAAVGIYFVTKVRHRNDISLGALSKKEMKAVFKYSLPVAGSNAIGPSISNLGVILLGIYAATAVIGNYGTAIKGVTIALLIYSTLSPVLVSSFSSFSKLMKKGLERRINDALRYTLIVSLPSIVFVAVLSKPLVFLLITRSFSTAPLYLTLISIGTFIGIVSMFLQSVFAGAGETLKMLKYNAFAAFIQLAALFILVPEFKVYGVIISIYYIGYIAADAIFILKFKKIFGSQLSMGSIFRVFISNLLLAVILIPSTLIHNMLAEVAVGIVLLVIAYPITLTVTRSINSKIIKDMHKRLSTMPVVGVAARYMLSYTEKLMQILGA